MVYLQGCPTHEGQFNLKTIGKALYMLGCFCHKEETITHFFFECCFARTIWSFFGYASNLLKLVNASHILGSWPHGTPNT